MDYSRFIAKNSRNTYKFTLQFLHKKLYKMDKSQVSNNKKTLVIFNGQKKV